ncbi:hypothetical protein M513_03052 [Trichuris suis]|uniref:Uncharacterized protein n=1 Tax=Trichuris suis TaxID=68888 RepID=A0A085MFD2_9BILA|nr:hypothetical protein M513_03052 [Trichuris suis]
MVKELEHASCSLRRGLIDVRCMFCRHTCVLDITSIHRTVELAFFYVWQPFPSFLGQRRCVSFCSCRTCLRSGPVAPSQSSIIEVTLLDIRWKLNKRVNTQADQREGRRDGLATRRLGTEDGLRSGVLDRAASRRPSVRIKSGVNMVAVKELAVTRLVKEGRKGGKAETQQAKVPASLQ